MFGAKTTNEFTVKLNNDGVVVDAQHWAVCFLLQHSIFGGADRDRTGDLLLAKQALSQLSYSPIEFENTRYQIQIDKWWAWLESN